MINCVNFSANDELLATGSSDKTAIIWDLKTGKRLLHLIGYNNPNNPNNPVINIGSIK